jgi:hypothetical protein
MTAESWWQNAGFHVTRKRFKLLLSSRYKIMSVQNNINAPPASPAGLIDLRRKNGLPGHKRVRVFDAPCPAMTQSL